jgi:tyrosinase
VHCLSRAINDTKSQGAAQQNIDACMKLNKFADAWPCVENTPHVAGHQGIGGEMAATISSPGGNVAFLPSFRPLPLAPFFVLRSPFPFYSRVFSPRPDPIFYLHHAFIDRVWWKWQEGALPARLSDFAGYTTEHEPATGWVNATLDDELNMFGIIPNATVRDLMDIRGGRLCYEYVDPN